MTDEEAEQGSRRRHPAGTSRDDRSVDIEAVVDSLLPLAKEISDSYGGVKMLWGSSDKVLGSLALTFEPVAETASR